MLFKILSYFKNKTHKRQLYLAYILCFKTSFMKIKSYCNNVTNEINICIIYTILLVILTVNLIVTNFSKAFYAAILHEF